MGLRVGRVGCPGEGSGALQATGRASGAYGGPLAPPRSPGLFQAPFICSPPRCALLLALAAPPGARDFSSTTFGFLRRPFLGGGGGGITSRLLRHPELIFRVFASCLLALDLWTHDRNFPRGKSFFFFFVEVFGSLPLTVLLKLG